MAPSIDDLMGGKEPKGGDRFWLSHEGALQLNRDYVTLKALKDGILGFGPYREAITITRVEKDVVFTPNPYENEGEITIPRRADFFVSKVKGISRTNSKER